MAKKRFKWRKGLRKSGYKKMHLFSFGAPFFCDCYLFKIECGGEILEHRDEMRQKWRNKKHIRLNFIWPAKEGGHFWAEKSYFSMPNIYLFRADRCHSVSRVQEGTRLTLSFGIALHE